MKRVEVVWGDAVQLDEGPWAERAGASKPEAKVFHQVGYVYEIADGCGQ